MLDVLTMGELLVDFIAEERGGKGIAPSGTFVAAPGGAPANVAVGAARLGARAGFIGKVGDDPFGRGLIEVLAEEGVETRGIRLEKQARTALAFVSLDEDGERYFSFFRHPSADMLYSPEELDRELISATRILHFGSIGLIDEPSRSAHEDAIATARAAGAIVSFDVNLRLDLWDGPERAREGIRAGLERAQVVKLSEEELEFLCGSADPASARELLNPATKLLLVTRGARGAAFLTPSFEGEVEGFPVEAIDATGAGDSFTASMLAILAGDAVYHDQLRLHEAVRRSCACAALCTTRKGAIPALPRRGQVEAMLARSG